LALWAFWLEPRSLVVHETTLALPHWSPSLSGLRVAVLSDLHVGSPYWVLEHTQKLVNETNQQHPDLILLAGDYQINGVPFGTWVAAEPIAEALGGLKAPLGTIAVLGNHDHWNDGPRMEQALRARGIIVLENQTHEVRYHGSSFYVVGLADRMTRPQAIPETIALVPPGVPAIVLVHEPDVFPEIDPRVSLTVAGHTHGGQVALPLLGRRIVPSEYGERYAAGHIVENGKHLFVTTGVGTSTFPVRFRVPPEIAMLVLK
jgi:predicted MPP superfamily phosphohydrolase